MKRLNMNPKKSPGHDGIPAEPREKKKRKKMDIHQQKSFSFLFMISKVWQEGTILEESRKADSTQVLEHRYKVL